ncbi:MAG: dethiobiotin synthase [Planctomycetes bacterium]|nr:dethiobiotin synthase [Planctomycetota bacterium]
MTLPEEALAREVAALQEAGLLREPVSVPESDDWISNDLFGLSSDPAVLAAAREALERRGAGARAARALGGECHEHALAEEAAASWLGAEAALLFPTGWQATGGVLGALAGPGDALICDALLHASLIDGARLTRARREVVAHCDLAATEAALLRTAGARRRIVVTEGVFSMDGTSPDLAGLAELAARHDAWLVVDEAHSAGLLGPRGAGAWAASGAPSDRLAARIVTGGKALGSMGAFAVGSRALRAVLFSRARSFLFTTGVAPSVAAALAAAIARVQELDPERERIRGLARRLAKALGLPAPDAAIVPIPIGSSADAMRLAERLRAASVRVHAVRPPTVPQGTARLRVVLHAGHDEAGVDALTRTVLESGWAPPAAVVPGHTCRPLWVVGTDTDAGKTIAAAAVVHALGELGPVAYWKPVQTGDDSDTATLRGLVPGLDADEPHTWFPLPASPHEAAAAAGSELDPAALDAALDAQLAARPGGRLVVEPAGGLHVPLTTEVLTSDWLARRREPLVLVARSGLGTLNHTLLTVEALAARGLRPEALILVGPPHPSNAATLRGRVACPLFELPHLAPLSSETVRSWALASGLAQALA